MLKVDVIDNHSFIKKLKIKPFYESKKAIEEELNNIISSFRSAGYLLADVDSVGYDSLFCSAKLHSGAKYKWAHLSKGNLDDDLLMKRLIRSYATKQESWKKKQSRNLSYFLLSPKL